MPLTSQQLDYLKHSDQRFRAYIAVFDAYEPTVVPPGPGANGELLAPLPQGLVDPRYAVVDFSEEIELDATRSYNRGGLYPGDANIEFALAGGSAGSIVDNGDGTADYTAPANTPATATIEMTATNGNGSVTVNAYVQYPKTTNDELVSEIASVSGSFSQHGWKLLCRVRGVTDEFAIGKRVLLHVEDTWGGTTATFAQHDYPEGVFMGYVSAREYFEDAAGEYWLGIEVISPFEWVLRRTKVGEMWWGQTAASGRQYIADFRPVDAIWRIVNEITDFSKEHNCTLWFDQNVVDDFITQESDLGTLFDDIMKRTLGVAFCDRYGDLMCVPDPDVRYNEWAGGVAVYSGAQSLTPDLVSDYTIEQLPYSVRKLTLNAFDKSRKGIFAISENPTAMGSVERIGGLLCDDAATLASWAVEKRAQANRQYRMSVGMFLNHTVDLVDFADVLFTAPSQASAPTASGRTWISNVTYRPNLFDGGWVGRWTLLQQTEAIAGSETGEVSAWGGTGVFFSGSPGYSGTAWFGSGTGGWTAVGSGQTAWCKLFDFKNTSNYGWVALTTAYQQGTPGAYTTDTGWVSDNCVVTAASTTAHRVDITKGTPLSTVTGAILYYSAPSTGSEDNSLAFIVQSGNAYESLGDASFGVEAGNLAWEGTASGVFSYRLRLVARPSVPGDPPWFASATLAGLGVNPFGEDNCP